MKGKTDRTYIASMSFMLMIAVGLSLTGCASLRRKDQISMDYDVLKKAQGFSFGGVGSSGGPSDTTIAFKRIFNGVKAKEVFQELLIEATYEGKLYALCALFYLDYDKYVECIRLYEDSTKDVVVWDGCIKTQVPLCSIIKKKDGTVVRLKDNKQSIDEWMKDHGISPGEPFDIDFYGGGIPSVLSEYINSSDPRIKDK